jgi:hypothetical protein
MIETLVSGNIAQPTTGAPACLRQSAQWQSALVIASPSIL